VWAIENPCSALADSARPPKPKALIAENGNPLGSGRQHGFPAPQSAISKDPELAPMAMKQTIEVLNRMEADGVIGRYCISGAVAALNYLEMAATEDLDILVSFEGMETKSGLVTLTPIVEYLNKQGYSEFRREGIWVEGWPVQFVPVATPLDREALESATEVLVELEGGAVRTRLLRPEHLVANALRTGRPKDRFRVLQFLESKAVDLASLCPLLERHALSQELSEFCRSVGLANPCVVNSGS
jgi:hypothetical protein